MSPQLPMLRISYLHVEQGAFTLDISDWSAGPGQFVLLAGPNGSGKTTFMESALHLRSVKRGDVSLGEKTPQRCRESWAFVPTDLAFFDSVRAIDLARFVRSLYPIWDQDYYETLTDRWKVPTKRALKTLSMGERRRLHLALALAHKPALLTLDEPLATLDPEMAYGFVDELRTIVDAQKLICWVSSNVLDPFLPMIDRVDFLSGGRLRGTLDHALLGGRSARDLWREVYG